MLSADCLAQVAARTVCHSLGLAVLLQVGFQEMHCRRSTKLGQAAPESAQKWKLVCWRSICTQKAYSGKCGERSGFKRQACLPPSLCQQGHVWSSGNLAAASCTFFMGFNSHLQAFSTCFSGLHCCDCTQAICFLDLFNQCEAFSAFAN